MRRWVVALYFVLAGAGCDIDVPDPNRLSLDELTESPTADTVVTAVVGSLIDTRRGTSVFFNRSGVLGREVYNFQIDPRNITEYLSGELLPGSFGGSHWGAPYASIRAMPFVLEATDKIQSFSEAEKAGIRGFVHTLWALELLEVIATRDDIGVVIDTVRPLGDNSLGEIVSKEEGLDFVVMLLDMAVGELAEAGEEFVFPLTSGFAGFDTPGTLSTFTYAIRARVAAYQEDPQGILNALANSFVNDAAATVADLEVGVYHTYSTTGSDSTHAVSTTSLDIFVHPSVSAEAETDDARLARKVRPIREDEPAGFAMERTSNEKFSVYPLPQTSLPIIRNEELLLLRAEGNLGIGDLAAAAADLNLIRTVSGELPARDDLDTEAVILDELVASRRYSLLYEGHRWIDVRRWERWSELALDFPTDVINTRFPIPLSECERRPGEPKCELSSLLPQ